MELISKLVQNLLLYFVIAIGENSVRMRNDAVMLSSVYDAMKNNYVDEANSNYYGTNQKYYRNNLLQYEERNKRNINEKWDVDQYDDAPNTQQQQFVKNDGYRNPSHVVETNEDLMGSGNELICSVYNAKQNHHSERLVMPNPFLDNSNWNVFSGVGYFLGKAVKFVLSGIALVSLPLIFLIAVLIPLKILMGLKAMTVTNSVVFGSLIYRVLNRLLTQTTTTTTAAPTTTAGVRSDLLDEGGTMLTAEDYPEYNEEQLQRIIENIKKKNKDW